MIFEPPADPSTITTFLFSSKTIAGHIEERGRLPGRIKFAGDGNKWKPFFIPGDEKSSISPFKIMPVLLERTRLPKL